jgi:hypothetical protein
LFGELSGASGETGHSRCLIGHALSGGTNAPARIGAESRITLE